MQDRKVRIGSALVAMVIAALALLLVEDEQERAKSYYLNQGKVFGTYYTIRYEAEEDLHGKIQAAFETFDNSLSMFNPHSTISAINQNRDTTTDALFEALYAEAAQVWELSGGAFDITVAPLVNLWGFGLKNRSHVTAEQVDSLLPLVGFEQVQLVGHRIVKRDPRIMLDGGAIAKGMACDYIASLLRENGCENYLVEIGGEIVCNGENATGDAWRIGVTKPNLNNDGAQQELQEILPVHSIHMATSGNYRNFYYEGEERRSHTIDPRTGRPVQHALLSATVISRTCMRADALATACMVLGTDGALDLIERAEDAACYLIVAQNDTLAVIQSPNWGQKMIAN